MKMANLFTMSLMLVSGVVNASEIRIENSDFIIRKDSSVTYVSQSGCKQVQLNDHADVSLDAKNYSEDLKNKDGEALEVNYEGKSSLCRYRAGKISLVVASSQNLKQSSFVSLIHKKSEASFNDIKLTCKRYSQKNQFGEGSSILFSCKKDGGDYVSFSEVRIAADLEKNTTISVEMDKDSI